MTSAIPTEAAVEAEIDAVAFGQGIAALEALANSITSNLTTNGAAPASSIAGVVVKVEDIAGMLDPALIPLIGGIRKILPMLSNALAMLEPAPQNPDITESRGR